MLISNLVAAVEQRTNWQLNSILEVNSLVRDVVSDRSGRFVENTVGVTRRLLRVEDSVTDEKSVTVFIEMRINRERCLVIVTDFTSTVVV